MRYTKKSSVKRNKNQKIGNPLTKRKGDFTMSKAKKKEIRLEELSAEEKMKYEVAEELGLLDKVLKEGWRSLTSKETGKIGGLVTKKRREIARANES